MNTIPAASQPAVAAGELLADLRHRAAWLRQPGLSELKLGGVTDAIASEFDRAIAQIASPLEAAAPGEDPAETLALICDALGIGKNARSRTTILANIENARRRSDCLWRVEHEFFMMSELDEDEPDGPPFETCLLNWGDDPEQYARKFGEVLASRVTAALQPAPVTDAEVEAAMRIPRDGKNDTALTCCMLEQFGAGRGLVAMCSLMTAEQHETKLARVAELIAANPAAGSADGVELRQLAREVECYENRVYPIAQAGLSPHGLSKRATELHEKAFMPWDAACELALSEVGLTAEALQAVIDDFAAIDHDGVKLMTPAELQAFARHVLVWLPLASISGGAAAWLDAAAPFQARVQPWMVTCFGLIISSDVKERSHRFFEESTELVQACGMTASEAHQLVDYVFGRPVGEKLQEAGGVMVTLAALCLAQEIDMHEAGEIELRRVWTCIDKIRAKQAAKPANSPLPIAAPARHAGAGPAEASYLS